MRSHMGRLAIGIAIILGGILYGVSSHQVNYKAVPEGKYQIVPMSDGTYGFVLDGTDTYYIVHPTDFTPMPDDNSFTNTDGIGEIFYKDEDPQSFIMNQKDGSQVNSQELTVVSFSLTSSKDQRIDRYASSGYLANPDGFYDNRWPVGILVAALGLGALGFFLMLPAMQARRRQKQSYPAPAFQAASVYDPGQTQLATPYAPPSVVPQAENRPD
ncbi:hypothetical protein KDK_27850 [Dictyobacter kobayashii]|uniref:Uncharacterized protein n=1 Tax=Dictyobacter kobayashii TaxID=2014872 RepID=A0A402AIV1_9CHLR|nr:hypothetical protein KDK_27850 [Dictyobacter kobayashii]